MIAVDTNVLVYAHRKEAAEHDVAKARLLGLGAQTRQWAIPWPCIYEFLGVVTNVRIWKAAATPPASAWAQVSVWLKSPSLRMLSETESTPEILERMLSSGRVRGPVVHDARIAALCLAHGVETLLSRDRDFSLFPELNVENPFA